METPQARRYPVTFYPRKNAHTPPREGDMGNPAMVKRKNTEKRRAKYEKRLGPGAYLPKAEREAYNAEVAKAVEAAKKEKAKHDAEKKKKKLAKEAAKKKKP
jgi:hypothetical protein